MSAQNSGVLEVKFDQCADAFPSHASATLRSRDPAARVRFSEPKMPK